MKFCIGKLLWESFKRRLSGDKYREESLGLLFSPNTRNSFSLLSVLPTNSVASHYLGISKFLQSAFLTSSETLITCTFKMTRARSSSVFLHFLVRVFAAKSLVFCSFLCSRRLGSSRNISSSNITWRAARTAWKSLLRDGRLTKRIYTFNVMEKLPSLLNFLFLSGDLKQKIFTKKKDGYVSPTKQNQSLLRETPGKSFDKSGRSNWREGGNIMFGCEFSFKSPEAFLFPLKTSVYLARSGLLKPN